MDISSLTKIPHTEDTDNRIFEETIRTHETYDVTEYATIRILEIEEMDGYIYYVDEPNLTSLDQTIRAAVTADLKTLLQDEPLEQMTEEEQKTLIRETGEERIDMHKPTVSEMANNVTTTVSEKLPSILSFENPDIVDVEQYNPDRILYYIQRDLAEYGKITPIMEDGNIEDIHCLGHDTPLFAYHTGYRNLQTNILFQEEELDSFVTALAQQSEDHVSVAYPASKGRLPDGSRVQLSYKDEISPGGSNFTIRLFEEGAFTPPEMIQFGTFTPEQLAVMWFAIENRKSMLFVGDTAAGKTSAMNAVTMFIPPDDKVVSIEDTREIVLNKQNWTKSLTRESEQFDSRQTYDMFDLLKQALRHRPTYMLVGEIRGEEARTLFQAMETGHATYSTMHADSTASTARRLINKPISLSSRSLAALDFIAVQRRRDKDGDIVRRCAELSEINGINVDAGEEGNPLDTNPLFSYKPGPDTIYRDNESEILDQIRVEQLGWSEAELEQDIDRRVRVLNYLVENRDTYRYVDISKAIHSYTRDPEDTMKQLENKVL